MYICKKHGILQAEWCDACREIISCDCTNQTKTRKKDILYDCENGTRTITIWIHHCETCGKISGIDY